MRRILHRTSSLVVFVVVTAISISLTAVMSAAAEPTKVTIAMGTRNPGASNSQLYAAKALGFFKEENLDVNFVNANGSLEAARAVAAGQVDFMSGTLESIPIMRAAGEPLQTVAQIGYAPIYSLAIPAKSSANSERDLPGKRVGVISAGSAGGPLLLAMLHHDGIDTSKITLVPIGGGQSAITAIESGTVDALMLFDSSYIALQRAGIKFKGGDKPVYWVQKDFQTKYPGQGIVYNTAEAERLKDVTPRVLRALMKSIAYCMANADAAVEAMAKLEPLVLDDKAFSVAQWKARSVIYRLPPEATGVYGYSSAEMWKVLLSSLEDGTKVSDKITFADLYTDKYLKAANDFDKKAIADMAKAAK
jgi:NitT/TauT family transport system substrate-binding protein